VFFGEWSIPAQTQVNGEIGAQANVPCIWRLYRIRWYRLL
jgi:hypothetical protein